MDEPVKVLYFVDRMLRGGIQTLVIDWVSRFDKKKIQVDFLLLDDGKDYELEYELKNMGCKVYKLKNIWVKSPIDFMRYKKAIGNFFSQHNDYDVIHLHSSSKNYIVLKYAKKYGIRTRIAHSHNIDFQTNNILKKIIGDLFKIPLRKYATDYFACSRLAGQWLFGKKIVNSSKFKVIHNAVDYEKFKFNNEVRTMIRNEFGFADNDIIIGHVGRFTNQKNHTFLIDIFNECHKQNCNYKLLLVGTGELESKIKDKVNQYKLNESVFFAGFRNDVSNCMQAMDIFVFPSNFEGLGLALVEAQTVGMPCLATKDTIPKEVKINNNFEFIELDKQKWVEKIIKSDLRKIDSKMNLKKNGYDINEVIKELTYIYRKRSVE